jgi:hypothetical protein
LRWRKNIMLECTREIEVTVSGDLEDGQCGKRIYLIS